MNISRILRRSGRAGPDPSNALLPLPDALSALGEQSWSHATLEDVPVENILGSVARVDDFDRHMRTRKLHLTDRRIRVASHTTTWPPVDLIAAGELYFVSDGHHRVSVAREIGMPEIEATVRRVCTVAYACACLSLFDLPSKAAEAQFLERYPLPDDVRPWLWLDDPSQWQLVTNSAEAWITQRHAPLDAMTTEQTEAAVADWWANDVLGSDHRCRTSGSTLQNYLCALKAHAGRSCPT